MTAVNPDGTPGFVAPDELIESAWGNAVVDTLVTQRGVGLFTGTFAVGAGLAPTITWTGEAFDTDGYHVASANDIVIPAKRGGVYVIQCQIATDTGVTAVTDLILNYAGKPYGVYIPVNRRYVVGTFMFGFAPGNTFNFQIYNEGAARNYSASMHMYRVSI
jgi:hypothetical protein